MKNSSKKTKIEPEYSHGFILNKNNEIIESRIETVNWVTKLVK